MIAYLDMPSGISGDMLLGCLADAGWPIEQLQQLVSSLHIPTDSWTIYPETVQRGPLTATLVHVEVAEERVHRHLSDIRKIIQQADLAARVQEQSIAVFTKLAEAEAAVHGQPVEQVHFHEVGALDAIIDIVGCVAGLHALNIEQLYASAVPLPHGWTKSEHGPIPLPAPATLNLLTAVQAPLRNAPGNGELVTPTGAALIATLARFSQPQLVLHKIGIGAGQKDFEWPNIARLWLAEPIQHNADTTCTLLETNIDDMNPELYAAVTQSLFNAGALDVWMTPIYMKKGRPGVLLSVLSSPVDERALADLIMSETTTLGIRVSRVDRHVAAREIHAVDTPYGSISVKVKKVGGEIRGAKPEYDECLATAQQHGIPVSTVWMAAQSAAYQQFMA